MNGGLPPHWQEVEQLQAQLREGRRDSRTKRESALRAMGLSETEVRRRLAEQDEALMTLESTYSPTASALVRDDELPPDPWHPTAAAPATRSVPAPHRRRMTASEIRADLYARGELVDRVPVDEDVDDVPSQRVEFDLPPTPGSTGRALTGVYRLFVAAVAGALVAAGVWLLLLVAAHALFGWAPWNPVLMVAAAIGPLAGLWAWVAAVRRDVKYYVRVGGRAPATWSKR